MQMTPFPAHYQLVYTNFDFSSFSRISCYVKVPILQRKTGAFRTQNKQKYYNETKKINRRSRQKLNFQTPNVSSLNTFCNFALAG